MKLLIIGDSHGQLANLKHVMGFGKKIGVKAVIHCGDWDNPESVETVLSFGIPLYAVIGNADIDSKIEDILKFQAKKFDPYCLKFKLDGRKIAVIHNAKVDDKRLEGQDIVFSGDWHSNEIKEVNFTKFVRPGAVINGNNFAIYETVNNGVEFMVDEQI